MEKVQIQNRLELKRQVITSLTQDNASNVKGGFTLFTIAWAGFVKISQQLTAGNAFTCGQYW